MKLYWMIATLCTAAALSACSIAGPSVSKAAGAATTAASAKTTASTTTEAPSQSQAKPEAGKSQTAAAALPAPKEEEEDLTEPLFRSAAAAAQMEITTGLTTEYLDMICSYPVTVYHGDETTVLKDIDDLNAMGLKALYTDELLKAVGEADPEQIVIVDDTAILGDPDGAYIVLGKDEYDIIGISEFHYPQ